MRRAPLAGWAVAVLLLGFPVAAPAQVWTEVGDAGGTAATAQVVGNAGATTTTINGFFAPVGTGNSNDMDVYRFNITNTAIFSASTAPGTVGTGTDTVLYLFRSNGTGLAQNDDLSPTDFRSTLPVGDPNYATLPAGQYLLAIGLENNRPTAGGVLIFPNTVGTGVQGPANTTGVFDGSTGNANEPSLTFPYAYSITLTGVSPIPEPGTLILCSAAAAGALGFRGRRKRPGTKS